MWNNADLTLQHNFKTLYIMGVDLSCIVRNRFTERNNKRACEAFIAETIEKLSAKYCVGKGVFNMEYDDDYDDYSITTEMWDIMRIQLCAGMWHIECGVHYCQLFFKDQSWRLLMQEIADALQGHPEVTVLVKNPVNPDIELWIGALQRIYNAGIHKLGAIHRGFSTYGKHVYRNVPQWHIPIELHRRIPSLPIICDPSHMGGKRELIAPIAQQALDMGFTGFIIESHCDPDSALSDSMQQVTPESLNLIVHSLVMRDTKQSTESLALLRQRIDRYDNELIEILNKRMRVSREIGQFKKEHNMQVVQTGRYATVLNSRIKQAEELGMSPDFMRTIMEAVHEESVQQQVKVFESKD